MTAPDMRGMTEALREFVAEMPYERATIAEWVAAAARDVPPGARVLDVGAGDAPYRELFAHAEYVTTDWEQSLHEGALRADVIASADALPLEDAAFDMVLLLQVLEHVPDPAAVLAELHRVLKPGGLLFVLSEPLRYPTDRKLDTGAEVREFEGNENIYYAHEYVLAARRAGFRVRLVEPRMPVFTGEPLWLTADSSTLGSAKVFGQQLLRRSRAGRKLLLATRMLWGPDAPLGMVCRKKD